MTNIFVLYRNRIGLMKQKIELAMEALVAFVLVFGFTFGVPWAVYIFGYAQ